MNNLPAIMRQTKLFEGFSLKDCENIISIVKPHYKSFLKNEVLIQDGDTVDYVGIVCNGKIITAKLDYEGNASLLYMLEPPKIFGLEVAATPTQISSITVTSIEDTWVAMFPYSELTTDDRLSTEFRNKLMYNMLTLLANENMRRMYKIELLCQKSLRERVLTYLRFVARKKGTSSSFTIPFNREQLAQYLNVNRSALSHELSLMQQEGLISFKKNCFTLHI
jgi:CRP-like cAMP-binding protein